MVFFNIFLESDILVMDFLRCHQTDIPHMPRFISIAGDVFQAFRIPDNEAIFPAVLRDPFPGFTGAEGGTVHIVDLRGRQVCHQAGLMLAGSRFRADLVGFFLAFCFDIIIIQVFLEFVGTVRSCTDDINVFLLRCFHHLVEMFRRCLFQITGVRRPVFGIIFQFLQILWYIVGRKEIFLVYQDQIPIFNILLQLFLVGFTSLSGMLLCRGKNGGRIPRFRGLFFTARKNGQSQRKRQNQREHSFSLLCFHRHLLNPIRHDPLYGRKPGTSCPAT